MAATYECRLCKILDTDPTALCIPVGQEIRCDYSSRLDERWDTMCRPMRAHLRQACSICGRPAVQADLICLPSPIPQKSPNPSRK